MSRYFNIQVSRQNYIRLFGRIDLGYDKTEPGKKDGSVYKITLAKLSGLYSPADFSDATLITSRPL